MKIKPVPKSSLVDTVVRRIRALIEQGKLSAGDRLPTEAELIHRLGVSRSVLREAVKRLETIGLLRVEHGRGMFVGAGQKLSSCVALFRSAMAIAPRDVRQFAEFRKIIECYAARRAAEIASPEEIAELQDLCDQMAEVAGEPKGVEFDWRFHRKLIEMTGNELLVNIVEVLQEFVVAGMWQTTDRPRYVALNRPVHQAIVDAIRQGDPDAAARAMQTHMDLLIVSLEQLEQEDDGVRAGDQAGDETAGDAR